MRLISSKGVIIRSSPVIPAEFVGLVASPWAKVTYGGAPIIAEAVDQQPAPGSLVFIATTGEPGPEAFGISLVDGIDHVNRRAQVHGAVTETRIGHANAKTAFVLVLAILGEAMGVERFFMTPRAGSRGFKLDMDVGFTHEGNLRCHEWGPQGRIDAAVVGASWMEIYTKNRDILDDAKWYSGG